jgi:hypothetical protein
MLDCSSSFVPVMGLLFTIISSTSFVTIHPKGFMHETSLSKPLQKQELDCNEVSALSSIASGNELAFICDNCTAGLVQRRGMDGVRASHGEGGALAV